MSNSNQIIPTNYDRSKLNAVKHGVLSRENLLAWEDGEELDSLREELLAEYQPVTFTEAHLVEELLSVIWRKRRLQQAENASIQRAAKDVLSIGFLDSRSSVIEQAVVGIEEEHINFGLGDILTITEEDIQGEIKDIKGQIKPVEFVLNWKEKNCEKVTLEGMEAKLGQGLCDSWHDWIGEEEYGFVYEETVESLEKFLRNWLRELRGNLEREEFKLRNLAAIKRQFIGASFRQSFSAEGLTRYEIHLDRKFERILGMLLKLKELRASDDAGGESVS